MNDKIMEIFKDLQNLKKVDLTPEQKNHVYATEGKFHTDFQGDLILSFNNQNSWYYNKDIELELNMTNNRLVDISEVTDDNSLSHIPRINDNENKFIIKNIKNSIDLKIRLEKDDTVEWSFKVLDNHSIDFDMSFSYDNLGILDDKFSKLNELSNYKISRELYISDLHKKIENQNIVIGDSEHIIKELNTIISDKDKAIVNKDILIKKKCAYIIELENKNANLNTKLNDKNKADYTYNQDNYLNEMGNTYTKPIEYSSKYNKQDSWNTFFNTNTDQYNNKSNENKRNFW